jgi:hypothetical protein
MRLLPGRRGEDERKVVLHYHLFKNAGTSLDALLQEQFPGGWLTREFPGQKDENARLLGEWIAGEPGAVVFSSHTAQLPPPTVPGVTVLPVIFVRHPLDRIASAYAFERGQDVPGFGATLARNTTLAGYVETRLSMGGDRQCRNFHTHRLAAMYPGTADDELERALRAVTELPFVGIVEDFAGSLARMQGWLGREGFTGLRLEPVERNVSRGRSAPHPDRLDRLAEDLGPWVHEMLVEANRDDLALYDAVAARRGG